VEAQRVARALRQRGHAVRVLCAGHEAMPASGWWTDPYGTPVKIIGKGLTGTALHRAFAAGVVVEMLRLRKDYDIVYFLMQGLHLAAGLPVARLLGKPILMKISGSGIITIMQGSFLGRLELRWLDRWASRVMILNEGIAGEARSAGIRAERLQWMPNPVDVEEFSPAGDAQKAQLRQMLDLPAEEPVAVFVGRLAPEKQLASLIDAFAIVHRARPGAVLALVGDGPLRQDLTRQAEALGLGTAVRFPGRQPMERVIEWLQAADTFTLVSSLEGFPCSLVEAMAAGLPSVVSEIPANQQLIRSGEQGWLAKLEDPQSIANALLRVFDSPPEALRMGQQARKLVVDRFSTEKVLLLYEEMFDAVLSGRN
jgi:glycosyltransferase involved in cell wall biosynthesis